MRLYDYKTISKIIAEEKISKDNADEIEKKILGRLYATEDAYRSSSAIDSQLRSAAAEHQVFGILSRSRKPSMDDYDEADKDTELTSGQFKSFIHIHNYAYGGIFSLYQELIEIFRSLQVTLPSLEVKDLVSEEYAIDICEPDKTMLSRREAISDMKMDLEIDRYSIESFKKACYRLADFRHIILNIIRQMNDGLRKYFDNLTQRHSKHGIRSFRSPVITDFALTILENVRQHGEVAKGNDTKTALSSYSYSKAIEVIEWVRGSHGGMFLKEEAELFTINIVEKLKDLDRISLEIENSFEPSMNQIFSLENKRRIKVESYELKNKIDSLRDFDPNRVKYREASTPLTEEEARELQFRNETIEGICDMLTDESVSAGKIVDFTWEKCKELRSYYLEENRFYQCRIGQGDPMSGKSSGHLEIIPARKPRASFKDIIGSGFDEVRGFVEHIHNLRKWEPIFLATSPRRSVDRNNVLLIGPQGCGKTECMRAIANEDDSICIFAQGSDFLTSWLGEAQKNPKRLFEAALKLHKDTGKHIHILIDEIDSVLNGEQSTSRINLSLEFQMIMDGVVEYPGISVWGTTNSPEKIPMPMIRRFSLVAIVGKLDKPQRTQLLRHFLAAMPLDESYSDEFFELCSDRLEGATGDVIRKVCERVWKAEVSSFIKNKPDEAEKVLARIKSDWVFREKWAGLSKYKEKIDDLSIDGDSNASDFAGGKKSKRSVMISHIKKHFSVDSKALDLAIDEALSNIGIINEISTAKRTYEESEKFLAQVKGERENAAN